MPRPCKRRRVCMVPACRRFGPLEDDEDDLEPVNMTVDEFESIRLIDLEGLSQEECAQRMSVARTTAQSIYNSARRKLAACLVEGRPLDIGGGWYSLCDGNAGCCSCCRRRNPAHHGDMGSGRTGSLDERTEDMKVAVTYDNGMVFQHFGHTEEFKVYTVEDGKVTGSEILSSNGNGHEALVDVLADAGVSALICGGIGGGAQMAIASAGLDLYAGVTGSADDAAAAFAAGKLSTSTEPNCNHHEAHAGGNCGHDHGDAGCRAHHGTGDAMPGHCQHEM